MPLKQLFPEERPGWRGYVRSPCPTRSPCSCSLFRFVEWEGNAKRKGVAHELLKTKKFTDIPGTSSPESRGDGASRSRCIDAETATVMRRGAFRC